MNSFTIRDIENLSGIKAHTIRIWEQRYSFIKPKRTGTNIRYYSNEELKTILNIVLLNKYGFKISHINRMSPQDIQAKILSLNTSEALQERVITGLIRHMIDLDMERFEEILDKHILSIGIERTVTRIVFPFLERIGILWQTGHINPAQEHLVTNLIRQKLIAGIDKTKPLVKLKKSFLLYLPEGEHHELGLLLVYFMLKSRGAVVSYLGANVPLKDVVAVAEIKIPDFIYTHLTSTPSGQDLERFLMQTFRQMSGYKTIISGTITQSYKKQTPPGIQLKKSLGEVVEFISTL
jgi:DNA-binding transcriptional MerR regulator